ncbi:MAG: pirin family protein [Fusobacteriaceae bacterium]
MLKQKKQSDMGESKYSWLYSLHHFSFGDYYSEKNMGIGSLCVLNDDIIDSHRGFETHPHKNMEILTYVLDGTLTHEDSIHREKKRVGRGSVQYMSAGTGISHSESNDENFPARIAQFWIIPDKKGYTPVYGQKYFKWEDRVDKLLLLASGMEKSPIKIQQNVNIYALYLNEGKNMNFNPKKGYQYYIAFFEGEAQIGEMHLKSREALIGDENIEINALSNSHMLIFEISKI